MINSKFIVCQTLVDSYFTVNNEMLYETFVEGAICKNCPPVEFIFSKQKGRSVSPD